MLEIRHLRTLSALRSSGSLVRAAQLLNLTQSALSHQIRLLEERYQAPLFERKSMPIAFTATGSRLLELADKLLPEIELAERDVARLCAGRQGAVARGARMPYLLRLADAGDGCVPPALAGSGD